MAQGSHDIKKRRGEKKPINKILILAIGAACVALAIIGYYVATNVIKAPEYTLPPNTTIKLVERTKADVDYVEIFRDGKTLTIAMKDDIYYAKEYPDDRINQSNASSMFYNAAAATSDTIVEENAKDLTVYGLDNPASRAVAHYKDGTTVEFFVGNATASGTTYYFMRQDDPNVYLVWTNIQQSFSATIEMLRDLSLPAINQEIVNQVMIERKGEESIEIRRSASDEYTINIWQFAQPFDDVYVDASALQGLIESIEAVSFVGYEGRFDNLTPYGLDAPLARFVIADDSGITKDLSIGNNTIDGYYTYVMHTGTNDVYRVSADSLSFISSTRLMPLVDAFASLVSIQKVDMFEIDGFGEKESVNVVREPFKESDGSIRKDSNGNTVYQESFKINGKEVNESAARALYTSVIGITINGRINESTFEPGEPVLTVKYTLNVAPGSIVVEYLPFDKDNYVLRVNGGQPHFYLRQEQVKSIITTLEDMRAGKLDK